MGGGAVSLALQGCAAGVCVHGAGPGSYPGAGGVPDVVCRLVEAAVERVLSAAHKAGKPAGVSFYPDQMPLMQKRIEQGARVLMVGGDEWMLYESCKKMIDNAAPLRKGR